jgi:hypothetical protein
VCDGRGFSAIFCVFWLYIFFLCVLLSSEFEPALEKQANEEIRKIEQNYHTMSLKGINSLVIKTLLKSDDNYLKCFGTK